MFQPPTLYAVTDTRLANLSHAAQVEELIAGGVRLIQLREKHLSPREFYEDALNALVIARRADVPVIINDRVDIALAIKADGVHLGQDDLDSCAARRLLGDKAIIGYSTHNEKQAIAAAKLPVDYIAIGPVFTTASKENPDPIIGLEGVRRVRDRLDECGSRLPLVAIGGIDASRAREVFAAGANSVAVIGALLKGETSIRENAERFLEAIS